MRKSKITYFENDGNRNFEQVIKVVVDYLKKNPDIKNVVVFAGRTESVFKLHEAIKDNEVSLTVATYPYGRKFRGTSSKGEETEFIIPDITLKESRKRIEAVGMNYIQGGLPFEPILSCTGDNSTEMIISAYDTISRGLQYCISAAVMSVENGFVEEEEKIISISGDTAITVSPTIRRDIFSGRFRIHEILCKPY